MIQASLIADEPRASYTRYRNGEGETHPNVIEAYRQLFADTAANIARAQTEEDNGSRIYLLTFHDGSKAVARLTRIDNDPYMAIWAADPDEDGSWELPNCENNNEYCVVDLTGPEGRQFLAGLHRLVRDQGPDTDNPEPDQARVSQFSGE